LDAKLFAGDIRAGLDDNALMNKYELSPSQLRSSVEKLLNKGYITESDLSGNCGLKIIDSNKPETKSSVPLTQNGSNAGTWSGKCPHCGMSRATDDGECRHCGLVFSKAEKGHAVGTPTFASSGQLDPEMQTGTYFNLIAGCFYAEASEVAQKKERYKRWTIYTAAALGLIPFPFVLSGYGRHVVQAYTIGVALFVFLYYLVVVYRASQQSRFLGLLCIGFSPMAILFVILNWDSLFADKLLPKLWLALMIPLTVIVYLTKYGHLRIFPCG
jgi:hypothetical protein